MQLIDTNATAIETNAATTDAAPVTNDATAIVSTDATETPAKPARKPRAPKAATAKPEAAPLATPAPAVDISAERRAAALAVAAFYTSGPSLPFKSASTKLADLNLNNAKAPSVRTAALVAAMLAYAGDNIKRNGEFTRGGFLVPAKLIDPNAKPGDMLHAMPESGCLGNMLGRVVHYVSGPTGGKQARDAIFRFDFAAARTELQQLGDATAKPALAVLDKLAPVKASKRAA